MKTESVFEGDLTVKAGEVYQYEKVTGNISASKIERGAFPKLTSNGGHISAPKGASLTRQRCRAMLLSSFAAAGFSFADGILARIVSQRGAVQKVVICGKTKISYVLADGEGNYAHGDTLDEARADLMVKRTSKDLTQFKAWTLERVVSKADAIFAYRSITGACSKGVRLWLEQRQTPESITVAGVIELTKGAYGAEKFWQFFTAAAIK